MILKAFWQHTIGIKDFLVKTKNVPLGLKCKINHKNVVKRKSVRPIICDRKFFETIVKFICQKQGG